MSTEKVRDADQGNRGPRDDAESVVREWLEREIDGYDPKTWSGEIASLAALLRQRDARVRREAVEMERERCAKIADTECSRDEEYESYQALDPNCHPPCCHASKIAAAIRARGTT